MKGKAMLKLRKAITVPLLFHYFIASRLIHSRKIIDKPLGDHLLVRVQRRFIGGDETTLPIA